MEIESLFSSTRWEIIDALSKESLSPIELAERLNTTSANISQQLRLLELANLVTSEKTSNVDKGKPRIIYSISGDNAFLILAAPMFANKRMLVLNDYHKFLMRSWFLENPDHHALVGEAYFALKPHLKEITAVAVRPMSVSLSIYIVLKDAKSESSVKKALAGIDELKVNFASSSELQRLSDITFLYGDKSNKLGVEK